jgi:hypothetical protein
MKAEPSVQTFLTIRNASEELAFDQITKLLGREPSNTRSIAHVTAAGTRAPVRSSQWTVMSDRLIVQSINEAFLNFSEMLHGKVDGLRKYCEETGSEVVVTSKVRFHEWDNRPFIELDASSIFQLSRLNASWQLDLVDLSEE